MLIFEFSLLVVHNVAYINMIRTCKTVIIAYYCYSQVHTCDLQFEIFKAKAIPKLILLLITLLQVNCETCVLGRIFP